MLLLGYETFSCGGLGDVVYLCSCGFGWTLCLLLCGRWFCVLFWIAWSTGLGFVLAWLAADMVVLVWCAWIGGGCRCLFWGFAGYTVAVL